ncbi:MAG: HAD-IC family P-type ATPase [Coleofasciculaceae cyanobacterium SM2_1_6]|nr:HAD-IC family P-type ATPase [Coleofasciculaceae cyanobacterium SM2_1_6]
MSSDQNLNIPQPLTELAGKTLAGETLAGVTELTGLTLGEVVDRHYRGLGNGAKLETGRAYWQIIKENIFTFINIVFFGISVAMWGLGLRSDGILVVVVVFGGVVINIFQEIWAKQQLDKIALLSSPKAIVLREGREQEIEPREIVLDDLLVACAGEQILVDGEIIGGGSIEIDESLLTGESDLVAKTRGDRLYAGTFCVSGKAFYVAQKVGKDTTAYQLTTSARAFRQVYTPLQVEINLMIRIVMLMACFLWLLYGVSIFSRGQSLTDFVHQAAVVAGVVPVGMHLAITLAYALGAVRMIGQDVLIQQANAVESLSNVDVLCLDKTGTLTSNHLKLHSLYPLAIEEPKLIAILAAYINRVTTTNKTSEAIGAGLAEFGGDLSLRGENIVSEGNQLGKVLHEIPFTSNRKWSSLTLEQGSGKITYILGAPEALAPSIPNFADYTAYLHSQTTQGWRVLMFASSPESIFCPASEESYGDCPRNSLDNSVNPSPHLLNSANSSLPSKLIPLGLITLSDELRPQVRETLAGFKAAGIELKIISGDNPDTVMALAKQAGVATEILGVSGAELAQMDETEFQLAAIEHNVFGRITPDQKARLVQGLRRCGRYVAMIGDGVNDVLSLKQANLGIAMESGAKATRGVADIVLLQDSFGALPFTFLEGQKIHNGIVDVVKLFLIRSISMTMIIFASSIVVDHFPFVNKHTALVSLVGVGFPAMAIPLWSKPGVSAKNGSRRSLVRNILHFTVPASLTLACVGIFVYLRYLFDYQDSLPPQITLDQLDYTIPRSALVTVLVFCQLFLIPFLKPPIRFLVGGESLNGDWRYTFVALGLLLLYGLILLLPVTRDFFNLALLPPKDYLFLGLVALEWGLIQRLLWRTRCFDRFLGVSLS